MMNGEATTAPGDEGNCDVEENASPGCVDQLHLQAGCLPGGARMKLKIGSIPVERRCNASRNGDAGVDDAPAQFVEVIENDIRAPADSSSSSCGTTAAVCGPGREPAPS